MSDQMSEKGGVYLNGKKQVIELLQMMAGADKQRLLRNLKNRNPALAKELSEHAFGYEDVWSLDDQSLSRVLTGIKPIILGLALSLTQVKNQKRALGLISRENALKAYEVMTKDLSANRRECQRAQDKILEYAMELFRKRIIQFF